MNMLMSINIEASGTGWTDPVGHAGVSRIENYGDVMQMRLFSYFLFSLFFSLSLPY
jgi:hypothetical protein